MAKRKIITREYADVISVDPPVGAYIQCLGCKYINPWNGKGYTCKAFPDGIPDKAMTKHAKIIKGQTGDYIYTPDKN